MTSQPCPTSKIKGLGWFLIKNKSLVCKIQTYRELIQQKYYNMSEASEKQVKSRYIQRVSSNQKYIRFKPVQTSASSSAVNTNSQQNLNLESYAQTKYNQIIREYKGKDGQSDLLSLKLQNSNQIDLKKQRINQFSSPNTNLQLDPIDQKIRIPFQSNYYNHLYRHGFKGSFQPFKDELRDWLIDVIQITCSITLNHLKKQSFNQKQAKTFASKNVLLNIKEFFEKHSSIPLEHRYDLMSFVNTEIHKIFTKISYKYPQNGLMGVSKRLKSQVHKVDNRESDEFDFLYCHKINITYREDGDYSEDIMKVINKLISVTADVFDINDPYQESNYQVFTGIMEYIFQNSSTQTSSGIAKSLGQMIKERKIAKGQDILTEFKSANYDDYFQNSYVRDQDVKKSDSVKQSARKILFGQKIPIGTRQFTQNEIEGEYFRIHHSSILRILTKWAEELRGKFQNAEEAILKRIYKFKDFNGNLMNLEIDLRAKLYESALAQFQNVGQYLDYLKKENTYMQTLFAEEVNIGKYCKNDTKVGTFASKANEISSQYIFKYINRLIHSLLTVPKRAAQMAKNDRDKFNISSANLITLKIGDLMRCRCSTTEREFLKILAAIEETNIKSSNVIKIIRIKNRLEEENNDLLINLFFANKFQCELQLSVDTHTKDVDKSVSTFNHYVYEIIRAELGPLSQFSIIIAQYDPLVSFFCKKQGFSPDLIETSQQTIQAQKIKEVKLDERVRFKKKINIGKKTELPFVCWVCMKLSTVNNSAFFYRDPQVLKRQCNDCLINRLKQSEIFEQAQLDHIVKQNCSQKSEQQFFKRHLCLQNYATFIEKALNNRQSNDSLQSLGFLLNRNQKKPKLQFFNTIFEKVSSKIILASPQKDAGIKILVNVPVNINNKKREEIFKRQFSNHFIFQCKNAKKVIEKNNLYFICNQEKCCKARISMGTFLSAHEIKKISNQKLIDDHFENQKSTVYLNNIPKAFEIVGSALSDIKDTHKKWKVTNNIRGIEAYNCSLKDIEILLKFPNIYQLNISNNPQVTSLKGIQSCQKLKILDCKRCDLKNISELASLKRLEHLNLSQNKSLQNINGLAEHTQLKKIYLNHTQITTLKPLQKCQKLQILDIEECKNIKSLSPIKSSHLNYIIIVNCDLQAFDLPVESLSNLKIIEIVSEQSENKQLMRKLKAGVSINLINKSPANREGKSQDLVFKLAKMIMIRNTSNEYTQ